MSAISRRDQEFYEWQSGFVAYAEAHAPEMKIPPEAVASLKTAQQRYEGAYKIYENPNRGKLDVAEKNDARSAYEHELRPFIKGYLYNPAVTDAHRRGIGIPDPKARTPIPAPETYPEAEADTSTLRRIVIRYRDNGSTSKAKPRGVRGAELRWMIRDTAVSDPAELHSTEFSTASPFTLTFQGHERGKTVYYCLRWESARGKKGPWGEIFTAVIP